MEQMQVYARNDEIAAKLRTEIETLPNHMVEELKTEHGGTKFEFFGTMLDGVKLMALGASTFGRL